MTDNEDIKPLVLVTGSAGLIGTRMLQDLSGDYTLVGLDIEKPDRRIPGTNWHPCDLTNDESVKDALAHVRKNYGGYIASVVHLAAYYDFSGEPSEMYEKLTVQGTQRLIRVLQGFDRVEQFIFSSSLLAMKPVEEGDVELTETSPTQGEWDYPQSKIKAEKVLEEEHERISVAILRLAGAYDEECRSPPISQQIRRIFEEQFESFVFPGKKNHGQPFVHLRDVASSIRATIEKRAELSPMETFLIAEPEVMSYEELQDQIGKLLHGAEWPTFRVPKVVAKAGAAFNQKVLGKDEFIKPWMIDIADDDYPVNIRRARERLGWEPCHRLSQTLPIMIERLKRNPQEWYEINNLPMPAELQS